MRHASGICEWPVTIYLPKQDPTILVKTFGTLCVLGEENVVQVGPPPP